MSDVFVRTHKALQSLTLVERWHCDRVAVLKQCTWSKGKHYQAFLKSCVHLKLDPDNPDFYLLNVKLKKGRTALPGGRLFAALGMQGLKSGIRRLLACGFYFDLDMINCFPTILLQIFHYYKIRCPTLTRIVTLRPAAMQEIADWLGSLPGDHLDIAKKLILVTVH